VRIPPVNPDDWRELLELSGVVVIYVRHFRHAQQDFTSGPNMQVTGVRIYPTEEVRAYLTIAFYNCFMIREIKVIKSIMGHFVSLPAKKQRDATRISSVYQ
jgi:SpoVG